MKILTGGIQNVPRLAGLLSAPYLRLDLEHLSDARGYLSAESPSKVEPYEIHVFGYPSHPSTGRLIVRLMGTPVGRYLIQVFVNIGGQSPHTFSVGEAASPTGGAPGQAFQTTTLQASGQVETIFIVADVSTGGSPAFWIKNTTGGSWVFYSVEVSRLQ